MKRIWWLAAALSPSLALAAPLGLDASNNLARIETIQPLLLAPQPAMETTQPGPYYIARAITFDATSADTGRWEQLADGRWIWRAMVYAQDAASVGITLVATPALARTTGYVYSPNGASVYRLRTQASGPIHSPLVAGDTLVVELISPAAEQRPAFSIARLDYGFDDPSNSAQRKSGSCNVDVVCPEGDAWRDEIRSVASYTASNGAGTYFCTGTLLANTSGDGRPLFLTANHCVSSESQANSMTLYWNFETSSCGGSPNGSRADRQSGAFLLATDAATDFALVELANRPNAAFGVHYAGWNTTTAAPTEATAIHHPLGDEKRISFEYAPPTSTSYGSATVNPNATHWRIIDWDLGTTEGGSSGSAIWDQNQRVIGQLEGGGAACGNDQSDWYGKLSVSWAGDSGNPCTSLAAHLDPAGSRNPTSIAGYDSNADGGSTRSLSDACFRADSGGDSGSIGGGSSGALHWAWLLAGLMAGLGRRVRRN